MSPLLYKPLFVNLILVLVLIGLTQSRLGEPLPRNRDKRYIIILSVFLILFLGLRPFENTMNVMGDTDGYARSFAYSAYQDYADIDKEFVFSYIMISLSNLGLSAHSFFLLIECLYIGLTAWAIVKLSQGRASFLLFLATISQFCFYGYGINGIRQGMAQALVLFALTFYLERRYVITGILCAIAYFTHSSSIFLIVAMIAVRFLKSANFAIGFWFCCLVASVFVPNIMEGLLESVGSFGSVHDLEYLDNDNHDLTLFSRTGYRWDFLLYSIAPIIVGWYYIVRKKYNDSIYLNLYNIYVITNGAWLLVNQSWLSNRIAYLSWFIYGMVLIYPMLSVDRVHRHRDRRLPIALLGNMAFTYLMWIIGKL